MNDSMGVTAADLVYGRIRKCIFKKEFTSGQRLPEIALAKEFDVSRTPVREALRKLEEEGLVAAEINQRARVRPLDPEELDTLYARRILAEALAVRLSVERFQPADIRQVETLCKRMSRAATANDFEGWQTSHRDFHRKLVEPAGDGLKQTLRGYAERSERYLYMLLRNLATGWWRRGEAEHDAIFDCYRRRDASAAVNIIVQHLARTAFQLNAMLAPDRPAAAVEAAVALLGERNPAANGHARENGRKSPR